MVQLTCLEDLHYHPACQNIRSLQDVIAKTIKNHKHFLKIWEEIEAHIINDRIAPSLPAYLVYEYQFKEKTIEEIAKDLGIFNGSSYFNIMIRLGIPMRNKSEMQKGENNPMYGKKASEETRRKMSKVQKGKPKKKTFEIQKLIENILKYDVWLHQQGDTLVRQQGLYSGMELVSGLRVSYSVVKRVLESLSEEEREYRRRERDIETRIRISEAKKGRKGREKSEDERKKLREARKSFVFTEEIRRKMSESQTKRLQSFEARKKMSDVAIEREKRKEDKYLIKRENKTCFHTASIEEGIVALLFEKYIPKYEIKPGETFQANGDTNCLYDFVLPDRILEWHPIRPEYDAKKLGFIGDLCTLLELRLEIKNGKDRIAYSTLKEGFEEDLAVAYWMKRQEASDNSKTFKGREVDIARNKRELYQFLSRYAEMPSYPQFRREFGQAKENVRQFKVENKKAA